MSKGSPRNLPKGITPKTRTKDGKAVPVVTKDGTPVYRVRVWDAVLKRQVERTASETGGRRDVREDLKTPTAVRLGIRSESWRERE